jgi:hypothetical protein
LEVVAVNLRFYVDPETGDPHIHIHGVEAFEVAEVLHRPIEDRVGRDSSRVALGQTKSGRYLRVIYVRDEEPDSAFVITAYDLSDRERQALNRRRRRRP